MDEAIIWKIIDSHFRDNPQALVRHHIDSFDDFYKTGIFTIFKEKNPVRIASQENEKTGEYKTECNLYFGGKQGNRLYFGKPVIYDEENAHYMFPNEARLRNMTYGMTIHYDIEVEFITRLNPGEAPTLIGEEEEKEEDSDKNITPSEAAKQRDAIKISLDSTGSVQTHLVLLEKIYLGKFPIMLQSDFCVLQGVPRQMRHTMGECRNDLGGYFIIDGKEKTIVAQEKFADNMLYIRAIENDKYLYSAEIRSVSENASKPIRTMSVKLVAPSPSYTNLNIVVNIPNVRKPVPLFIVFRALGILSDREIISYCLLDMEKYESMVDLFVPSVHDGANILAQHTALKYIATLTKGKTVNHALEVLSDYFLPHIGELTYRKKAYFLGNMVFRLLSVYTGIESPTDRDNFKYKRVELVGSLLYDLFREYWNIQLRQVYLQFEKKLYYNPMYETSLFTLIMDNYRDIFRERTLEKGFRKAFKGNWGAQTHTKRIGIIQDVNRLSFNSALNHLRKTNLPLDSSAKLVGPRLLNGSQWGFLDPIDTPDGGSIGLHKHLAISTYITRGMSREPMIEWVREKWGMKLVEEYSPIILSRMTKVIINGNWIGSVNEPIECVQIFQLYRRNALIPIFTSAAFDIKLNTIFVYTDAGRLCRPIFYRDGQTGRTSFYNKEIMKMIESGNFSWEHLITGFNEKKKGLKFDATEMRMYLLSELYEGVQDETNPAKIQRFIDKKAILDYIDTSESETAMICLDVDEFDQSVRNEPGSEERRLEKKAEKRKIFTHCEIHESFIFGMMCNMIVFPENNPASRNSFSCGQSKQSCSMYHTNYQVRMDKTAVVLNYGQIPLVKTRYLDYIQHEENPYGENAIVAIMCYTGYNVEDAVLINEGALKRGLFRTSYFTTYEAHEEKTERENRMLNKTFMNVESNPLIVGTKPGYDYSQLDKYGVIREGTIVNDETVLIGLVSVGSSPAGSAITIEAEYRDDSKTPKKGQVGVVEKTFITEGEEGNRIAKVRIVEQRVPSIGDKMASRAGQKGTIGLIIPERDMPFTSAGIQPDIIINPHAIPSRMTIGQLIECVTGKACAIYGGFGDCTAFVNKGSKTGVFGELLTKANFHSSGNEILYNGMTGEQIESEIFIGPTYYMRLKHMVKDKINYRAQGPRTALTKQPVSGRANDGGLRIGEMERDSIISHGATNFLRESMMERGDKSYAAICNKTGMLSIYNPANNLFMSPMADGPIRFSGSFESNDLRVEHVTKYGRDFSVICIPYSLKLLVQELQTINVQIRIITEDNIEQIENMSYSNNIEDLLQLKGVGPNGLIRIIKESISKKHGNILRAPADIYTPEVSPTYPTDVSPAYQPSVLDEIPDSPSYVPYSPMSTSPDDFYSPTSPEEGPTNEERRAQGQQIYSPTSPEEGPTSEERRAQGQMGGSDFEVGDRVFLRGGNARPWQIAKGGDKFMTIAALDTTGLTKDQHIKVVGGGEIYKSDNVVYNNNNNNMNQFGGGMPMQFSGGGGGMPALSGATAPIQFTFAPKIITGGNDNSVGVDPVSSEPLMGGELQDIVVRQDIAKGMVDGGNNSNNIISGGAPLEKDFNKGLFIVNKGN